MCVSRKYPYPHHRGSLEIQRGRGSLRPKFLRGKKNLCGASMNIFWNNSILTEKVWKYLIRLVYDVVTFRAAIAFFKASCDTLITELENKNKKISFRSCWTSTRLINTIFSTFPCFTAPLKKNLKLNQWLRFLYHMAETSEKQISVVQPAQKVKFMHCDDDIWSTKFFTVHWLSIESNYDWQQ